MRTMHGWMLMHWAGQEKRKEKSVPLPSPSSPAYLSIVLSPLPLPAWVSKQTIEGNLSGVCALSLCMDLKHLKDSKEMSICIHSTTPMHARRRSRRRRCLRWNAREAEQNLMWRRRPLNGFKQDSGAGRGKGRKRRRKVLEFCTGLPFPPPSPLCRV